MINQKWAELARRSWQSALCYLQLNLFLTLVSFPVLVAWGLPISLLSLLGNFFFGPVLGFFLFISSLVLFCQLCGIPCDLGVWVLEQIVQWWTWIMSFAGAHTWSYAFACPAWWALVLLGLVVIAAAHVRFARCVGMRVGILLCVLMVTSLSLKLLAVSRASVKYVACNAGKIAIVNTGSHITVVDCGALGSRCSALSWCKYTLLPELAKHTGKITIDHLVTLRPTVFTFEAFAALCQRADVRNIYVPYWQGNMPGRAKRAFCLLREAAKIGGQSLIRIGASSQEGLLGTEQINLKHLTGGVRYADILYEPVALIYTFDNESINFYPASYVKRPKAEV